jgi:hypothetical protein
MGRATRMKLGIAVALIAFSVVAAALPKEWIEETLGFEPDGGNGLVELAIAVVPFTIGVFLAVSVLVSRRRERAQLSLPPPE